MKTLGTLFMLLVSGLAFAASGSNPEPTSIWIANATIISPENLDHIEKGNVLVQDGRIARVDRTARPRNQRDRWCLTAEDNT